MPCILAPIFAPARKHKPMNPVFLCFIPLFLFSPGAMAASWQTLQTNAQMTLQAAEPQQELADKNGTDKQKKQDRKLKVWDKISYSRPQQAMPGDFYYAAAKTLNEVNCTARTIRMLQKVYYGSDGNEIKSIRHEAMKPETIVPDTQGEAIFDFACTLKPEKAVAPAKTRPTSQPKAPPPNAKPTAKADKPKEQQATKTAPGSKAASPAPAAKQNTTKK